MSVEFKAGRYYVGDLCYVINDEHWDELGEKTNWFQDSDSFEFKGKTVFIAGTAYGDGTYSDNCGLDYSVDAGVIGCIPYEIIDNNFEGEGGQILDFEKNFIAYEEGGTFYFGNREIYTKDFDEEDDEYYFDDEYEEEDEE